MVLHPSRADSILATVHLADSTLAKAHLGESILAKAHLAEAILAKAHLAEAILVTVAAMMDVVIKVVLARATLGRITDSIRCLDVRS